MNERTTIMVYVMIDDVLKLAGHECHILSQISDAEVLTVAVSAALYFHNHQEQTLHVMEQMGYLSGYVSISRFNRRLHQLCDWLERVLLALT
jgi:diaminopimelate decarboxylase